MKKVVLIAVTLMLFVMSSMVYAGQFGPLEPTAKKGKASLGSGYFYYSSEWRPEDPDWKTIRLTQNQAYFQASYGIAEDGEVYFRFGFADVNIKDAFVLFAPQDFRDILRPFGTIGIKGVINATPSFGIGYFLQGSIYSNYTDKAAYSFILPAPLTIYGTTLPAGTYTVIETMKTKRTREISFGIGLQGKIGDVIVYGGPFAYWARAKADHTIAVTGPLTGSISDSTTYKEENNVGGFAGIRLPLGNGFNFGLEGQLKSRFSIGGALTYSF